MCRVIAYGITLFLSTALVACGTSVKTTGAKVDGPITPVKSITIVARDDNSFTEKAVNSFGQPALNLWGSPKILIDNIFTALEISLPRNLKANGVQDADFFNMRTLRTAIKTSNSSIRTISASHTLTINPIGATSIGKTEASVAMNLWLTDMKTKAQVWKGSITYRQSRAFTSAKEVEDADMNEFIKALLVQLKKDGILNYPTNDPIILKD